MLDPTIQTGQFDYFSAFADVLVENGTDPFDFCSALRVGIDDIYFVDRDGSFSGPPRDVKAGISVVCERSPRHAQICRLEQVYTKLTTLLHLLQTHLFPNRAL